MAQIFTSHKLNAGQTFSFYSTEEVLSLDAEVEIWTERENNGLGDPVIYGKARVIQCPYHPAHLYMGLVLSGENCN